MTKAVHVRLGVVLALAALASAAPLPAAAADRPPSTPGAVDVVGGRSYGNAVYVRDSTPILSVRVTDPDGDRVAAQFTLTQPGIKRITSSAFVASGTTARSTVTDPPLGQAPYTLSARSFDGRRQSAAGPARTLVVDTEAPAAPSITGPSGSPAVGSRVQLTFDSDSDVAEYRWGVTADPTNLVRPPAVGAAATVQLVVPAGGPNLVRVRALDRAGNLSEESQLTFKASLPGPSHVYRLDGDGVDTRAGTVPGTSPVALSVPPATSFEAGVRDEGGLRPCDRALSVSRSAPVTRISTRAAPIDTSRSFSVSAWLHPTRLISTRTATGFEAVGVSLVGSEAPAVALGYRRATGRSPALWFASLDDNRSPGLRHLVVADKSLGAVTEDEWAHVVLVWNAVTRSAVLYVDRQQVADRVLPTGPFRADSLRLGSAPYGAGHLQWSGRVDEVQLFQGPIDFVRVQQLGRFSRDPCPA